MRKLIHVSSLWIVVLYHYTDQQTMLAVLVPVTLIMLLLDGARRCGTLSLPIIAPLMHYVLRTRETDRMSGGSYMMVAALIMVLCFPKMVVMTGFMYLLLADSAAALIGKKWGKHSFAGKTIEGSAAFFITCLFSMALLQTVYDAGSLYVISAVAAALVATLVEAYSLKFKLDDNLSIPLATAMVMVVVQYGLG